MNKEITEEEMYHFNDERLTALENEKCSICKGSGEEHVVCDQGHYGHSIICSMCKGTGNKCKKVYQVINDV